MSGDVRSQQTTGLELGRRRGFGLRSVFSDAYTYYSATRRKYVDREILSLSQMSPMLSDMSFCSFFA